LYATNGQNRCSGLFCLDWSLDTNLNRLAIADGACTASETTILDFELASLDAYRGRRVDAGDFDGCGNNCGAKVHFSGVDAAGRCQGEAVGDGIAVVLRGT